jgi:hypothetical protein
MQPADGFVPATRVHGFLNGIDFGVAVSVLNAA